MTTVIVDYNSGNLHSAEKSFQRMAQEVSAGKVVVSSDPDAVAAADRIVLPGVGAFADCRAGLASYPGLFDAMQLRITRHQDDRHIGIGGIRAATDPAHEFETIGRRHVPIGDDKVGIEVDKAFIGVVGVDRFIDILDPETDQKRVDQRPDLATVVTDQDTQIREIVTGIQNNTLSAAAIAGI